MLRRTRILPILLLAALVPAGLMARKAMETDMIDDSSGDSSNSGLRFVLGEGADRTLEPRRIAPAAAEPLPAAETEAVLARLPALEAQAGDAQDFALRPASQPAPVTGETVVAPFPPAADVAPPATPAVEAAGPLEVVRFAPEGEVPLAPSLSVTFSQPMVALTAHEDLARAAVPVRLSPEVPGSWRWVGTKTLLFTPEAGRFPMATEFRAEVPAGTASASGAAAMAQGKSWSFSTPAPQLVTQHPTGGPYPREPLVFLRFDQRVDPHAVLPTVRLTSGAKTFLTRLASAEEVAADPAVSSLARASDRGEVRTSPQVQAPQPEQGEMTAGRWLALRPVEPLPVDTEITVTVGPGTPSAEGPRRTEKPQSFSFRTYGPLAVAEHYCGWRSECPPFAPWTVRFTNPLDPQAFDAAQMRVEPELPGMKVSASGTHLTIQGRSAGRTTYKVTLDAAIADTFGQTLGRPAELSFAVGSAEPMLTAPGGGLVVTDPGAGTARFSVYSINHRSLRVRLYAVEPQDWGAFAKWMRESGYGRAEAGAEPPGRLVQATTVEVRSEPDQLAETRIDLEPALKGGLGQVVVVVEPPPGWRSLLGMSERHGEQRVVAWVQATRIGLGAFVDRSELLAWTSALSDGKPLAGVELSLLPQDVKGSSGADGLARLELPQPPAGQVSVLVARKDGDVAILPEHLSWWSDQGGWVQAPVQDAMRWVVFDDRGLYRPGEEVRVKGWIRRVEAGKTGDLELVQTAKSLRWRLFDSRNNETASGQTDVGELGGFDLALRLPDTMNLGHARLHLDVDAAGSGRVHQHTLQVQEFRRPEFEVTARSSEGPHIVGGALTASVRAAYYAGGPLPGAEVHWNVSATPGHFTPPGWDEFSFGTWIPWWWGAARVPGHGPTRSESYTGQTDAGGEHHLRIELLGVDPPQPQSVTAEASVLDVNRQAWSASTSQLVHPATLYVGLRTPRAFVQRGEPLLVEAIVPDLDGKAVAGRPIELRAARQDWTYEKGEYREVEADVQSVTLSSAAEPVPARFETAEGGTYKVSARVKDDKGRPNRSELTIWVAGGKRPPQRTLEKQNVELVPDAKLYRPGQTAELLLVAPFAPAEGLLTLRREGLLHTERFTMQTASHTLRIPITEGHLPGLQVQVDLVGSAPRTGADGQLDESLPKRPAYASGALALPVSLASRTLTVTAQPREPALEPGGQTEILVEVKDASGAAAAGSEVAVVVVDEAILALTGHELPDPLGVFYPARDPGVRERHLREHVQLADPGELEPQAPQQLERAKMSMRSGAVPPMPSAAPMAEAAMAMANGGEGGGEAAPAIRMRSDFNPLALFAPAVRTDADGRARIAVKLPDNLTRYRVWAVAVSGARHFGKGESTLLARLPLMVRPSAPRFLNFGDRFELPVVVQNQTDRPLSVDVAVRTSGLELLEGAGRRTTVPPNDRVEVRFPAATLHAGTARVQVGAVSGRWADAAEVSLPVWTPATTEAFATYGELDGGSAEEPAVVAHPVQAPSEVWPQFGALEVTTSSTLLQTLTDAVLYLVAYPFECAEQLSSRVLAVAALRDVLSAFEAEGLPPPAELEAAVRRDLERLRGMQNGDGGFGFWMAGRESWPYVSLHVAHALARVQKKGLAELPSGMLDRSKSYLRNVEQHIPGWYNEPARRSLRAYALYVRRLLGDADPVKALALVREAGVEGLSLEALGWLLPTLQAKGGERFEQVQAILRHLQNRVSETAAGAHFVTSYGEADYLLLHSDRRTDAVLLEALIEVAPRSDLIPKLVRGLLGHRTRGRWQNTQENVFVLLALDRYFHEFEAQTPDFVARIWLGDGFVGEHAFRGRTTERFHAEVPMRYLLEKGGTQNLVLAKDGPGRLYYRLGLRYAPRDLTLEPADHGFVVERAYEPVDDPNDVWRTPDGVWHVRAGAKVRVRLTMVASARRTHVALVDPLPAGLEAMNPALAVTGSVPQDPAQQQQRRGWGWWWQRNWFEHQNLRDERAEAFTSLLWEGVYHYTYVARATTPGTFVVPPTKAEEMYHPETFGRGGTDRLVVE